MESLLRREIANCVTNEIRDPRIGFITITRVEMTDDLQSVTAYYTVLGAENKNGTMTQQALDNLRGFVQRSYAKAVSMRRVPLLNFKQDAAEDKRFEMNELISKARATDPRVENESKDDELA